MFILKASSPEGTSKGLLGGVIAKILISINICNCRTSILISSASQG